MQYMLLIYENEEIFGGPEKNGAIMAELGPRHFAFVAEIGDKRVGGAGLKGSAFATTVRTAGGKQTIHDGPFAETREQLGGYYVIEAEDLDEAIAIARKVPLGKDGAIEVRPVLPMPPGLAAKR
jgi:hypothetical protein